MPLVGATVVVDHLGTIEHGIIDSVDAEARTLQVRTERGGLITFALNRATATFTTDGGQTGSRLRFEQSAD